MLELDQTIFWGQLEESVYRTTRLERVWRKLRIDGNRDGRRPLFATSLFELVISKIRFEDLCSSARLCTFMLMLKIFNWDRSTLLLIVYLAVDFNKRLKMMEIEVQPRFPLISTGRTTSGRLFTAVRTLATFKHS